jgi:hypothetical protein
MGANLNTYQIVHDGGKRLTFAPRVFLDLPWFLTDMRLRWIYAN